MRGGFYASLIRSANQLCERRNYGSVPGSHLIEWIRIEQVWINEHRGCHPQFDSPVQLVTSTVANEYALLRLHVELARGRQVNIRVRLSYAKLTRERDNVNHVSQPRRVPRQWRLR